MRIGAVALFPRLSGQGMPDHVALTFDDGPDPAATPLFLDAAARARHRARPSSCSALRCRGRRGWPPTSPTRATRSACTAGGTATCRCAARWPRTRISPGAKEIIAATAGVNPWLFRPPYGVLSTAGAGRRAPARADAGAVEQLGTGVGAGVRPPSRCYATLAGDLRGRRNGAAARLGLHGARRGPGRRRSARSGCCSTSATARPAGRPARRARPALACAPARSAAAPGGPPDSRAAPRGAARAAAGRVGGGGDDRRDEPAAGVRAAPVDPAAVGAPGELVVGPARAGQQLVLDLLLGHGGEQAVAGDAPGPRRQRRREAVEHVGELLVGAGHRARTRRAIASCAAAARGPWSAARAARSRPARSGRRRRRSLE